MPKYLNDCMTAARAKLDTSHPGFQGSDEIRAALANPAVRQYLSSWVFPLFECALNTRGYEWVREHALKDANRARSAVLAANPKVTK